MAKCEDCTFKPGLVGENIVCPACSGSGQKLEPIKVEKPKKGKK